MDPTPPVDGGFELLPGAESGSREFRIARRDSVLGPDSIIAAGTTYAAGTLHGRDRMNVWADYVAAEEVKGPTGYVYQHYVRALPTTPVVTERNDPLWGKVYDHAYRDLLSNSRPDVADDFSISGATLTLTTSAGEAVVLHGATGSASAGEAVTLLGTRKVLSVNVENLGNGACRVVVTTAANASVSRTRDVWDEESGTMIPVTETWTITATKPTSSGLNAARQVTEVEPVSHNIWKSTTRAVSGLPGSRAEAVPFDTTGKMYWPQVLQDHEFTTYYDTTAGEWVRLPSQSMREPFAGDVKVTKRKWFQTTAPTITMDTELISTGIRVGGINQTVTIEPCLHGTFLFKEFAPQVLLNDWMGPLGTPVYAYNQMVEWTQSATNPTDWPATVTKTNVANVNGGYLCEESIYHRPANYLSSSLSVSHRDATTYEILTLA